MPDTRYWNADGAAYAYDAATNPPWATGVAAIDGDTIDITQYGGNAPYPPASNQPAAGTFNFSTGTFPYTTSFTFSDWLDGAAIGNVTVTWGVSGGPTSGQDITGNVIVTKGTLTLTGNVGGTVELGGLGTYGRLKASGAARTVTGLITLHEFGTLAATASSAIVASGGVVCDEDGAYVEWSSLTFTGSFDSQGYTVTHTSGGTWNVLDGNTISPGGVMPSVSVAIAGAATANLRSALTCNALAVGDDAVINSDAQYAITIGSATVAGGAVAHGGTLDYVPFAGGFIPSLNFAGGGTLGWSSSTSARTWTSITVVAGKTLTLTATAGAQKWIVGTGCTVDINSRVLYVTASANDFWEEGDGCTITATTGYVQIHNTAANYTNAGNIDLCDVELRVSFNASRSIGFNGTVECGALKLVGSTAGGHVVTLNFNGGLDCDAITLGGANNASGVVVLATNKTHAIGALAETGDGAAHAFTYAGTVTLNGNQTWSAIAVTLSGVLLGGATLTINGASATSITVGTYGVDIFGNGQAVTVSNIDYADASKPIRLWNCTDGGGNGAGVTFLTGTPNSLAMVGVGT